MTFTDRTSAILWILEEAMASLEGLSSGVDTCSCRPENGGSGVCGCILGCPKVTC